MKQKEHIRFLVEFDHDAGLEFVITKFIVKSNTSVKRVFRNLMNQNREKGATGVRRLEEWD